MTFRRLPRAPGVQEGRRAGRWARLRLRTFALWGGGLAGEHWRPSPQQLLGRLKCRERHTAHCTETTFFFSYPASLCSCPGRSFPALGHPLPPASGVSARYSALAPRRVETGYGVGDGGAKATKLPSAGPLKRIIAFSKADFAQCQGEDCLSRHLSVLVKKQKACQGLAGPWDRDGFLRSPGRNSALS